MGSVSELCEPEQGTCECLPNVAGPNCSTCEPNFWGLTDGSGCSPCSCSEIGRYTKTSLLYGLFFLYVYSLSGSVSLQCDDVTGDCQCKSGVTGSQCDSCEGGYYGFSNNGCRYKNFMRNNNYRVK